MKTFLLFLISLLIPGSVLATEAQNVTQDELIARQQADSNFLILDVRSKEEFSQGHIPGALNFSHKDIAKRLSEIPDDKDLIIYCRSGKRAGIAINILSKNGYKQLFHLDGDMNAWLKNKRPVSVEK